MASANKLPSISIITDTYDLAYLTSDGDLLTDSQDPRILDQGTWMIGFPSKLIEAGDTPEQVFNKVIVGNYYNPNSEAFQQVFNYFTKQ